MSQILIETSTITMNVVDQGHGPAVLLCHGFPETSHAWRHQIDALSNAGFRVIAPDMRGFGGSDSPDAVDEYTLFHIVGDMVALLDALGENHALIVGNDWGATVAWQAAQLRPDRFSGVVGLSVPIMGRPPVPPTHIFPQTDDAQLYVLYFQQPGVAEAELEQDIRSTLRKILFAASGDAYSGQSGFSVPNPFGMISRRHGLLTLLPDPEQLPAWLTPADLNVYTSAFTRSGFRGGLNYYRNLDRNWQLQASLTGVTIEVPGLFIVGERDTGLQIPGMREIIEAMPSFAPRIREPLVVKNGGHWLPQECPDEVSTAIIEFARSTLAVP